MTVTTTFYNRFLDNDRQRADKKPDLALAWSVHKKIRREALDPRGSFRDGNSRSC
jgi:hypothetical protein